MILTVTCNPAIDHTLWLDALRLHDVNRVRRSEVQPGGKGVNVSLMLAELGLATVASGFVGGENGRRLVRMLEDAGVACRFVEVDGETRGNMSLEDAGPAPTSINLPGPEVSVEACDRLMATIDDCGSNSPIVASGSLPPGVPTDIYHRISSRSSGYVVIDVDGEPLRRVWEGGSQPQLLKPNEVEAERLLGRPINSASRAVWAAREIRAHRCGDVLLTLGSRGAVLATVRGVWVCEGVQAEVVSTIGSGDAALAGYLWGREEACDEAERLRRAMACGLASVATPGSQAPTRESVLRAMDRIPDPVPG